MAEKLLLFVDDSGSRNPDHEPPLERHDKLDWFALGGILIAESDVRLAIDLHKAFVASWGIDCALHSTKIRGRRKEFSWLGHDAEMAASFHDELGKTLLGMPVLGIACVIDRPGYNARYKEKYGGDRWLMCKTAYAILVERAAKHAQRRGAQLEIYFEGAGREEDRNLLSYHKALKAEGMPFDQGRSAEYGSLSAEDFRSVVLGDPRRQTKANVLIQIADLYLYPLVKGGYDPAYAPYVDMLRERKIVDAVVDETELASSASNTAASIFRKEKGPTVRSGLSRSACIRKPRGHAHSGHMAEDFLHCK